MTARIVALFGQTQVEKTAEQRKCECAVQSGPTKEQWKEIADLLYAGRKIQAIKAYREITEAGLKEAKDSVEKLEQQLREEFPEKFAAAGEFPEKSAAAGGSGCLGVVLLAAAIAGSLLIALQCINWTALHTK